MNKILFNIYDFIEYCEKRNVFFLSRFKTSLFTDSDDFIIITCSNWQNNEEAKLTILLLVDYVKENKKSTCYREFYNYILRKVN